MKMKMNLDERVLAKGANIAKIKIHDILPLRHLQRESDNVYAWQIEGCIRKIRRKAAVAKVHTHSEFVVLCKPN